MTHDPRAREVIGTPLTYDEWQRIHTEAMEGYRQARRRATQDCSVIDDMEWHVEQAMMRAFLRRVEGLRVVSAEPSEADVERVEAGLRTEMNRAGPYVSERLARAAIAAFLAQGGGDAPP